VVAFIDTDRVAAFFTGERFNCEIGYDLLAKFFSIDRCMKDACPSIANKLELNEVISELFTSPDQPKGQSNTLCMYWAQGAPLMVIRIAQGPVQADADVVSQRLNYLQKRAKSQNDTSAQAGLMLAAKLEVETDRNTGIGYMLQPELVDVIVSFHISCGDSFTEFECTPLIITRPNRTLKYDIGSMSVSMTGTKAFRRKMIPDEITFLDERFQQAVQWALEATAKKE